MKKTMYNLKQLSLVLLLSMMSASFTACSNDDDDNTNSQEQKKEETLEQTLRGVTYAINESEELTVEQLADEIFGPAGANGDDPEVETMRAAFLMKQRALSEKKAEEIGANGIAMGYKSINYTYNSVDEHGKSVELSARVYWGVVPYFGALNPDYMVLCPHFTIGSNTEAPTQKHTYEAMAITGDNLLIMPDYKGFGVSRELVQPYCNHELCAQNSIDAMKAGYKIFLDTSGAEMENNWKLYIIGASQGGGNALAIHKYLDTHPEMAKQWHFEYSYCCAGPYSPSLTFQKYFEQKKHPYPCVFPFVIKEMLEAYPDVLGQWTEDDFYTADFVKNHKAEMDWMVNGKEYSCDKINEAFFKWYPHTGESGIKGGSEILLTDFLNPAVLDTNSDIYKALFKCLQKNDLTTGWTPTHKIKLYHGEADEIVPYANSQAVADAFPEMATLSTSGWGTGGHLGTCIKWLGQVMVNVW